MEIFIGVGVIVLLVIGYILAYALNEKTAVPEGCENLLESAACGTCSNHGCSIKPKLEIKK